MLIIPYTCSSYNDVMKYLEQIEATYANFPCIHYTTEVNLYEVEDGSINYNVILTITDGVRLSRDKR